MKTLQKVNTFAFCAMVLVNFLANVIPFGGNTTGEVSAAYPNLFTPAPITFAIWGVIYLLLGLFVLYQWGIFDNGEHSDRVRQQVGYWFAVSCLLNIEWIVAWHFHAIFLSLIGIVFLLFSLIKIESSVSRRSGGFFKRMFAYAGFDIYFGWIIAATLANLNVFLVSIGGTNQFFEKEFWATLMILIGAVIGFVVIMKMQRWVIGLALTWAYGGIFMRHLTDVGTSRTHWFAIGAAAIGMAALICITVVSAMRRHRMCQVSETCDDCEIVENE